MNSILYIVTAGPGHNIGMASDTESARLIPKAFISYSWSDEPHKEWVGGFAKQLRGDGIDVTLDQWHTQPGDQLPAFMETAIRVNDFVLIICTPHYADRSNRRVGGAGYEGDIMTGEVFAKRNIHKFIPVLRSGDWQTGMPTWLSGKYGVDLRGTPFSTDQYLDLINTLHGTRPKAPPIQPRRVASSSPANPNVLSQAEPPEFEPIRILNIVVDEVTAPRNDGTHGSALYRIPFQLSRRPSSEWSEAFIEQWNHPPKFTSMHRPGIATVSGDRAYLNGTTMEEVQKYHRHTLVLALNETNRLYADYEQQKFAMGEQKRRLREEHERKIREGADGIKFD